ncbi:DUF6482 family protein [Marinobacter sp. 1Y8]
MRMTLEELQSLEHPRIALLELLSLEGQFYIARLHFDMSPEGHEGTLRVLSDAKGKTVLFKSAWQAQNALEEIEVVRTDVVHASAYHEMVGLAEDQPEHMRIPVQGARR